MKEQVHAVVSEPEEDSLDTQSHHAWGASVGLHYCHKTLWSLLFEKALYILGNAQERDNSLCQTQNYM